jgi:hypothetical protein
MRSAAGSLFWLWLAATTSAAGRDSVCGTEPAGRSGALALHRYWSRAGALAPPAATADRDVDHVAVLEDHGDLIARRNPFDLAGAAIRLVPNAAGAYDPVRLALPLEPPGSALALADDESRALDLPFVFRFYGRAYSRVYVHSDGNLTLGAPDAERGERGLARFLSGPPRLAPFFADLDPARGGSVSATVTGARALVAWDGVPGAGQINRNSFAVALHANGDVDFVYGELQTREAIVGSSPGGTLDLTPGDLSEGQPRGAAGAMAERFSESEKLDLVSVARRFYSSHADAFDQLVVYATRPLNPVPGTLAFELNVRNDVQGIGLDVFDDSGPWGSAGVLASVVYMDTIDQYLAVDGFEILGHEVGHRWLTRVSVAGPQGAAGGALRGRGGVHWSFFLDSDASVMEGNEIEDRGGGRFETVDFARGYSALDQYAMGLRAASEVPPFFYVEAPDDFRPHRTYTASSAPEAGVSFTGRRRDLSIEDVVAAMGPRLPGAATAPRLLRQAFILVADVLAPATEARLAAAARIRARFETYYREATGGRGIAISTLP